MYKLIILTLLALLFFGCEKTIKEKPNPFLSENTLKEIVLNAINGERIYNDSLSGLIDYSLPLNSNFNALKIDRLTSHFNKTFFTVLIEYPNPIYNRFAIYDRALHCFLMDKSLNGKIVLKSINLNKHQFIEIDESFLYTDVIELNRVSLYKADSTVTFEFRTFTKFATPKNEYFQIITEISPDRIKTNLTSTKRSLISDKSEIFTFDKNRKKYLSTENTFNNFIMNQVARFKGAAEKPEIIDENSTIQSVGIKKDADAVKIAANIKGKFGYYLAIDESWKEIRDIGLDRFANRLKGNKYYNPIMGTNIFIAQIPQGDSAEKFVNTGLRNVRQGKYRVRFTDKIEQNKNYIQYFEFSCGKKKYLMIFEASKYTYEKFKTTYQDIINSFVIEC